MSNSNLASAVKRILADASITYTAVVLFVCFVLTGVAEGSANISPLNFLFIFPFSLCFSLANYLHRSERIGKVVKVIFHFILTIGGFFCFLYLPAFRSAKTSNSILVLFIITVIYLIVYGTVLLLSKRWKREFQSETSYTPQFSLKSPNEKNR